MRSFLLIGQSNMAGRGRIAEAHQIDASRIYTLRNGRWQKMFRPINPDRAFSGVNLAERFAERFVNVFNEDAGLICCADGGTKLDQWKKGEVLYENAVNNARLAMRSSTLSGILWHQGESDCGAELASTYMVRLAAMKADLYRDLGIKDVPFIVGGLGDFLAGERDNYKTVNEQLKMLASEDEWVEFASAERLGDNGDKLHFNSDALYEFGSRYFDAFKKIYRHEGKGVDADNTLTEIELL